MEIASRDREGMFVVSQNIEFVNKILSLSNDLTCLCKFESILNDLPEHPFVYLGNEIKLTWCPNLDTLESLESKEMVLIDAENADYVSKCLSSLKNIALFDMCIFCDNKDETDKAKALVIDLKKIRVFDKSDIELGGIVIWFVNAHRSSVKKVKN